MTQEKIIILGLGNTLISDDGIGIYVVRRLRENGLADLFPAKINFSESSIGGLRLLDEIANCDIAIIIDSIITGKSSPGSVKCFEIEAPQTLGAKTPFSTGHTLAMRDILLLGKELGYKLPHKIYVLAIEVVDNTTIKESLSSELAREFTNIFAMIKNKISELIKSLLEN